MFTKDMSENEGYLCWNEESQRFGCWNPQKGWIEWGFHCGDGFAVANGVGYDTDQPETWTDCVIERLYGKWEAGEGYCLVNTEEKIIDCMWLASRKIRLE